ncbi:MAG: pyridoxal phosphate-dependent aminotransferase [Nitrospirales bacterium]
MTRFGNQRLTGLVQSEIRAMTTACTRVKGINLAQGVCDTGVPTAVIRSVKEAVDKGINTYTRFDGLASLRQALANKLALYNAIKADPETEITVSCGATGAFQCACMALLNPGDEVIVFEPFYGYHISTLEAVQAVPRVISLNDPRWDLRMDDVVEALNDRTRAIVINTPANPSGKVFTKQELEDIGALAQQHDLLVFTDEIYEYFLYDQREHISLGSFPGMADRTITISGYSKTFSITGWRIGHAVAPASYAELIGAMNDLLYVCAPAPLQYGVAVGIQELGSSFYQKLRQTFQDKRDRFCEILERVGLNPTIPQGAYYVLADVSRIPGETGKARAMWILEKTGVAGVPGEAFFQGDRGSQYIRFSYAKTEKDLAEACSRLAGLRVP